MKLAVYNVENLFNRARVMNQDDWSDGKAKLADFSALNSLLGEEAYTAAIKQKIVEKMIALGLEKSDQSEWVILRRNRGALVKRPESGGIEVVAGGRADWVGSLELVTEPVNHESMLNTARVIKDVDADVLAVVEAESRPALGLFNKDIVKAVGGKPYQSVMVIDGNDERGIDVGIVCKKDYDIEYMVSHVNDRLPNGENLFSRDCPEYYITTPGGNQILVLVNHFKSKGYGRPADSNAKRLAQAKRVRQIYDQRLAEGWNYIVVAGDLNDTPASDPLAPLHQGTSMKDIFTHSSFDDGGHPGTYGLCSASNKIDYLLLSPDLFTAVTAGGVFRKGMWPGVRPPKWKCYDEVTRPVEAGSDHACIWFEAAL
jgi:endonuclease/exonuclease/phosphatase family metal-dependent hydrolase